MTITSMALPVDIPWERWCVSEDMIDKKVCDTDRPAKWQSSIAAFKYVPDDDYQIYPGRKITYVKVVCTVSGYQAKADEIQGILSTLGGLTVTPFTQDELDQKLATYFPCNEAIVQVTVAPPEGVKVPLDKYPYFMDFQPRKREMIETATDTNEVMSRSLESLNLNKSAGTSQSQEVLDIDQGFSVGGSAQGSYAGTGGGGSFNYSQQGQWGTKQIGGNQSSLARTTDESHERRETVSHSAQISQLRHLLDSYHVGTNRAVFFVQPRPHVLQEPSGIVGDSPRPIEGIQEFFLIVNQPKDQPDFCLDVRLDTGHLQETEVMAYAYKTDIPDPVNLPNKVPVPEDTDTVADGSEMISLRNDSFSVPAIGQIWSYSASAKYNCVKRADSSVSTYTPPPPGNDGYEYVIDVNNLGGTPGNTNGFQYLPGTQVNGDGSYTVTPTADGSALTITLNANSKACFKGSANQIQINTSINGTALAGAIAGGIFLGIDPGTLTFLGSLAVSGESVLITYEAAATAIAYAGAPASTNKETSNVTVAIQVFLRSKDAVVDTGQVEKTFFMTTRGLCCCKGRGEKQSEGVVYESNHAMVPAGKSMMIKDETELRTAMRQEILRSLVSSRRTAPRPFAHSQIAINAVLPTILKNRNGRIALNQPAADLIPKSMIARLSKPFREAVKYLNRLQLLTANIQTLANVSGLSQDEAHQLKAAMLAQPFQMPAARSQARARSAKALDQKAARRKRK